MADALSPGVVVAGTFEVERLLGRGGMGEVWLARHQRLSGKQVAIKVLHTQGPLPAEALARFRREAEIAVRLEHPNIVQVLDFNSLPSGQPFIAMEYLKGESLAARLKRGPLSADETSLVMRQVGSALHAAHGASVVHRDLKPENIFLVPTGLGDQVKVLDFGISKLSDGGTMQTTDSVLMGTPLYMSPEQALGHNRDVTPQSDVFSLGSIAYECLAGKAPFEADSIAKVVFRIAYEPHPPLRSVAPSVPEVMAQAVEHALQKDRAHRTPSVAAFVLELTGQVLTSTGTHQAFVPRAAAGVLKPGEQVDEAMMLEATRAPVLATPNPSARSAPPPAAPAPVAPPPVTPASPAPTPGRRPPMALLALGVVAIIAAGTFLLAKQLDRPPPQPPALPAATVDAGATAAVVLTPPPPPVIDAGLDEGALDAGAEPVDAGAEPVVKVKTLAPPSPADLAVLATLEADLKKDPDGLFRRAPSVRNRLSSKEGVREYLVLMVELSCKRSDLGSANLFLRQLAEYPAAARADAKRRCRRHAAFDLD